MVVDHDLPYTLHDKTINTFQIIPKPIRWHVLSWKAILRGMCVLLANSFKPPLDAKVTIFVATSDERWNVSSPAVFTYCCLPPVDDPGANYSLFCFKSNFWSTANFDFHMSDVKCEMIFWDKNWSLGSFSNPLALKWDGEALICSLREAVAPSPYSPEGRNGSQTPLHNHQSYYCQDDVITIGNLMRDDLCLVVILFIG